MKCTGCQRENPANAKFCLNCGAPLAHACAKCRSELQPSAKYCPECGERVAAGADPARYASPQTYTPKHLVERILTSKISLEGERKQVTVLFADLTGSMELLADRDPEDARTLLDPVIEHMMEAVHRFEGTVSQVMGDGIMALFGAPLAHEDHALRACYAALRMQENMKRYGVDVARSKGVRVQIRVGLNSGEVVVGAIGSNLRMDYTAIGQTTHLAARMEQLAIPGTILLAPATMQLVEGYVQAEARGHIAVKGLTAPIETFELTGVSAIRSRLHASARRGFTRFVGRDVEMDQLRLALRNARSGRGQLVAVVGDPGLGKSRLVYEFTHNEHVQDFRILETGSVSYGKFTTYLPVVSLLKAYFTIADNDTPRDIEAKVTRSVMSLDRAFGADIAPILELLDVPANDARWSALDSQLRQRRTLETLKRLFLRECQIQPLCLVFEDLQWIDSETECLLDALVENLPTARMLLLVNYRPEYRHGWGKKTDYRQLQIGPLASENAETLLKSMLGDDPALQPLTQLLIERTEGNPFFLEESVRSLVEAGALVAEYGKFRLDTTLPNIQVPASVQTILAARIDRLPPEDKRLLQTASVIGKDVPFGLLEATVGIPEPDLRRSLGNLQANEFLYEATLYPDLEYTFKHALTHEVRYSGILQERRRALHARIVDVIEQSHRDRLEEQLERLAHHALRGALFEKAVQYLYQSGVRAANRWAYRQAAAQFEQALALLPALGETPPRDNRELDLLLALGRALIIGKGYADAEVERVYSRAQALSTEVSDPSQRFAVVRGLWTFRLAKGEVETARHLATELLHLTEEQQLAHLRSAANLSLGQTAVHLGSFVDAHGYFERVVEQTQATAPRRRPTQDALVTCYCYDAQALWHLGRLQAAVKRIEDAIARAKELTTPYNSAFTFFHAGCIQRYLGDKAGARRWALQSIALSEEHSFPYLRAFAMALRGWSGSETEAEEALAAFRQIGAGLWGVEVLAILAEVYADAERYTEALKHLEASVAEGRRTGERWREAEVHRLLGELLLRMSPAAHHEAEESFSQALQVARDQHAKSLELRAALSLSRLWCRLDKRADAHHLLAGVYGCFTEDFDTADLRDAKAFLGELSHA